MSSEERDAYGAGAQDAYERQPLDRRYSGKPWLQDAYARGYRHEIGDTDDCPY